MSTQNWDAVNQAIGEAKSILKKLKLKPSSELAVDITKAEAQLHKASLDGSGAMV